MEHSKKLAHATLAGILSLAAAHDDALAQTETQVKCYGIAAAHQNACGTKYSACAGQIATAKACYAWIAASDTAACTTQGGSVQKPAPGCLELDPNALKPTTPAKPAEPATQKSKFFSFLSFL
jgi:uncharacterized membrane protein